jgi:hypothetical protein
MGTGNRRFKQVHAAVKHSKGVVTPVVLHTCLEPIKSACRTVTKVFSDGAEDLRLFHYPPMTLDQFERQSICNTFFSDPQNTAVQVELRFELRHARLEHSMIIYVNTTVKSDVPLTIGAVVSRALDCSADVGVTRRWVSGSNSLNVKGVPREIINGLKTRHNLDAYFTISESTFHLWGVVAPTDEERVSAISNGLEE